MADNFNSLNGAELTGVTFLTATKTLAAGELVKDNFAQHDAKADSLRQRFAVPSLAA